MTHEAVDLPAPDDAQFDVSTQKGRARYLADSLMRMKHTHESAVGALICVTEHMMCLVLANMISGVGLDPDNPEWMDAWNVAVDITLGHTIDASALMLAGDAAAWAVELREGRVIPQVIYDALIRRGEIT